MDYDVYKELRKHEAAEKAESREVARDDFGEAQRCAGENGLVLVRRSEFHYQLWPKNSAWMINLYPGNGRIYSDTNKRARAPWLDVPDDWTLLDVVQAASQLKKA